MTTCFGGGAFRGYETAAALGSLIARGLLWAVLPLYATVVAAVVAVHLIRGRISRKVMLVSLTAPLTAVALVSTPVQIGYVVWVVAVAGISIGAAALYASGEETL